MKSVINSRNAQCESYSSRAPQRGGMGDTAMTIELYKQYWRTREAQPSSGRMMPRDWGSLPDPLSPLWMPYAFMFQEFYREMANAINAFTINVDRLASWAVVAAPLSDEQKMYVSHEFVDTLATNAVNAPYVLRSRLIFATAHLCHQANRTKQATWVDDLPLDGEIYFEAADRFGAPWRHYNKLKRRMEAIGGRDFQAETHDFRNAYNHRFSPHFIFGIANFVVRNVDPMTHAVSYGFGGTPALELPQVVALLTHERDRIYSAFEAFQALVREHEDAIRAY